MDLEPIDTPAPPKNEANLKPISEKKRLANQRNALKSKGPKTVEGKQRSSQNALRHGLCAQSVVLLPGEDAAAHQRRTEAWTNDLQPVGDLESYLVKLAVDSSWRLDRCRKAEAEHLASRMQKTLGRLDQEANELLLKLIDELPKSPCRTVRRLRSFSQGVEWLIGRFQWLLEALEVRKYWEPTEKDLALNLLGKAPESLFRDTLTLIITEAHLNAGYRDVTDLQEVAKLINLDTPPKGMELEEFERRLVNFLNTRDAEPESELKSGIPTSDDCESEVRVDPSEAARRELVALLRPEIERLETLLPILLEQEEIDSEIATRLAGGFDTSREGQIISRYEASHRRALQSSIRDLLALRKANRSGEPSAKNRSSQTDRLNQLVKPAGSNREAASPSAPPSPSRNEPKAPQVRPEPELVPVPEPVPDLSVRPNEANSESLKSPLENREAESKVSNALIVPAGWPLLTQARSLIPSPEAQTRHAEGPEIEEHRG